MRAPCSIRKRKEMIATIRRANGSGALTPSPAALRPGRQPSSRRRSRPEYGRPASAPSCGRSAPASADRMPPAQKNTYFLSCANTGLWYGLCGSIQNSSMPRGQWNAPGTFPIALQFADVADIDEQDIVVPVQADRLFDGKIFDLLFGRLDERLDADGDGLGHSALLRVTRCLSPRIAAGHQAQTKAARQTAAPHPSARSRGRYIAA